MQTTDKAQALDLAAEGVLTVAAAAAFLGLSRSRIYELMGEGVVPFIHLGRRRVVPRRALVLLIADRLANPTAA
jgi:excisionase family DNA binding protein